MKFKRIDIHAHLNFDDFEADREEVIKRAHDSGTAIINVGTDVPSSKKAIEMANNSAEGMYAIIGLHPTSVMEIAFDEAVYEDMLKDPKVVGIGECGLDYFRLEGESKAKQKQVFEQQIALAQKYKKPLMLHLRDAYADALDILRTHKDTRGNAHFFAGTTAEARQFLDIGFTISFTGVVTFAKQYAELIDFVPLDMIQVETDCPFVAPVPYRGKRCEPSYVSEVTKKIAEIKKLPLEEVEATILENSRRVWGVL